jgi:hypothetical protein
MKHLMTDLGMAPGGRVVVCVLCQCSISFDQILHIEHALCVSVQWRRAMQYDNAWCVLAIVHA